MPAEFSRTTARKTVELPSGDRLDIPVITKIAFVDPYERNQETEHQIENGVDADNKKADRRVHVDQVHPVEVDADGVPTEETPSAETTESLYVERIDDFKVIDPFERYQESQLNLDNITGNDALPPHFSNHVRTHIYRYHKDPQNPDDDGVWIDSELIDEFAVIDPYDRYQETRYTLVNPTNAALREGDVSGQTSEEDPDITIGGEAEGTEDNPVRLDPFQNIVNYSSGVYVLFLFKWHDFLTLPMGERCTLTQNNPVPGPLQNTFTPGIQTRVASAAAVDVVIGGDALDSLLNGTTAGGGQPEVVTTAKSAQGYWKFPPCFNCATNFGPVVWYPPGDPYGPVVGFNYCSPEYAGPPIFAAPVPYTQYERSFLFEIQASEPDETDPTAGNTATTKIEFDIFGLPEPRLAVWIERHLPTYPGGPGTTTHSFNETNQNNVCQLEFNVYVFNKSAVDLYLTDKVFPLRKKDILPTAPDAVDQTKALFKTWLLTSGVVTQGWIDESNFVHEPLSDAPDNTAESGTFDGEGGTGSEAVQLKFHFEKFEVGPGAITTKIVDRDIAWPVEPDGQVVTALISGNPVTGTPVFGPVHNRKYVWFYTVNGQQDSVLSEFEKDFGQQPINPPTA